MEKIIEIDFIKPYKMKNGELQNYCLSSRIIFFRENFYLLVSTLAPKGGKRSQTKINLKIFMKKVQIKVRRERKGAGGAKEKKVIYRTILPNKQKKKY